MTPSPARPTLLLADSHDDSRAALADLLRECGYSVLQARDAEESLRTARERLPGLVVVDLWPVSASLRLVEGLRGSGATKPIPVLVLTASVSAEWRKQALDGGCAGYLEKPCPPGEVLAAIHRIVGPPPEAA